MAQAEDVQLYKCLPIPHGDYRNIFDVQSIQMVLLHNIIIRGYNSLLYYSAEVQPGTKKCASFLKYCHFVNDNLLHHHANEEQAYFVFMQEKMGEDAMKSNIAGHEAFHGSFDKFKELADAMRANQRPFVAEEFRAAIHAFMPTLRTHLAEEIDTIRPDVLRAVLSEADLGAIYARMEDYIKNHTDLVLDPPSLKMNGDAKNGAWFPPMPAPLMWVCMNILYYKNSDAWAFASCTKDLKVKPQFAAYEPVMEDTKQ